MKQLAENISRNKNFDSELINLVLKLHGQLAGSKGKKVYGYLKSDVKKTVDEIFFKLAGNESIKKMYELWCEMEQQKHDIYSSAKVDFPSLIDNKEFKSVKNMIVQTVMKMEFPIIDLNAEISEKPEENGDSEINSDTKNSVENERVEIKIQPLNLSEQQEINNQNISDTTEKIKTNILANTVLSLFVNLSRCIEDDYHNKFKSGRKMIDSKLRRMIREKNLALGIKQEHGQTQEY